MNIINNPGASSGVCWLRKEFLLYAEIPFYLVDRWLHFPVLFAPPASWRVFLLRNKKKLESSWITKKINDLNEYLQEVNFRIIDEDIEKVIFLKKEIAKCRTLDAIHIATALEFSSLIPTSDFYLYTFDKNMADLAKSFKLKTNKIREEDFI